MLHSSSRAAQTHAASPALPATVASSLAAAPAGTDTTGATTSLNGWIRSVRRQKNVSFAVLSDGSQVGGVQVVLPKGLDESLSVGCSATFKGKWVDSRGTGQDKEFKVESVDFVGASDAETYPMPNTKQGIPLPAMRRNAHLRLRKEGPAAMVRARSEMNWAMAEHFRRQGFVRVEMPITTSCDCEGAGEVFRVVEASSSSPGPAGTAPAPSPPPPEPSPPVPPPSPCRYLTVSTQLHLEAITSSLPRAYTLAPCFRAEKSDTARHLQEFWMLEAEVAFLDAETPTALDQVMSVAEETVRALAGHVREMPEFERYFAKHSPGLVERLETLLASERYVRMSYSRAVELLQEHAAANSEAFVFRPTWGSGLQTEHERWLAEEYVKGPLFVTDYPTTLKPFYMLPNERSPTEDSSRQTTACFDLLVPSLGELAGGSLREHRLDKLVAAMDTHGLDRDAYEWYLDLRRYGTTRHGGFGLGWERLVGLLTGENNVRECTVFPRAAEGSRF
ncbi:asparaginyl-tRNA synthetase [Rhodotorula toruloides]|uniref:asparagine--tRNA ligase n=1 Tax=Rhodotorula toruloides TaxID=5286 RepID=A0A511KB05_RHOTO|nr:asparaginyl-tRNA synthetase [Rhodotorula toruloides]